MADKPRKHASRKPTGRKPTGRAAKPVAAKSAGSRSGGPKRVQRAKQRHPAQPARPGAKRPLSPRVKRRRTLLTTVLLGLAVIGFLFAFVYPTRTFLRQRDELSASEQRLAELEHQTALLERQNAKLDTPEEIERIAREQYGMARPGETPYVLVPGAPTTTTPPSTAGTQP